ncbi:MAG TPA: cytochrome C oxidase subunit IV family protein [Polyangia bacterium]|nr:cytochrome C oxidase subunit IV family protein [Polyangia bacterium]
MASATETHVSSPLRLLLVWVALCALTVLTFGLHHVALGGYALPAALVIAVVKSALVALVFMELWEHRGANRLVFAVSVLFVLLLMSLAIADVLTRFPLATPTGIPTFPAP